MSLPDAVMHQSAQNHINAIGTLANAFSVYPSGGETRASLTRARAWTTFFLLLHFTPACFVGWYRARHLHSLSLLLASSNVESARLLPAPNNTTNDSPTGCAIARCIRKDVVWHVECVFARICSESGRVGGFGNNCHLHTRASPDNIQTRTHKRRPW